VWPCFAHAAAALRRTEPLGGGTLTPGDGLGVQIIEVAEATGSEERVAGKPNGALHPTFLVAARHRYGTRLEMVVGGQLQERGMKADGIAAALEHGAFKVVIVMCL